MPWATLGMGDDGILAFKRMGVVKCQSPFGAVDWVGARRMIREHGRQDNSGSPCLFPPLDHSVQISSLFPSSSHQS